VYCYHCS